MNVGLHVAKETSTSAPSGNYINITCKYVCQTERAFEVFYICASKLCNLI